MAAVGGGAAADAAPGGAAKRPRPAHPQSLEECLYTTPLDKDLCCSVCLEPFKQARTRLRAMLRAARSLARKAEVLGLLHRPPC